MRRGKLRGRHDNGRRRPAEPCGHADCVGGCEPCRNREEIRSMWRSIRCSVFAFLLMLAGAPGAVLAADKPDQAGVPAGPAKPAVDPLAAPEIVKPIVPSKAE